MFTLLFVHCLHFILISGHVIQDTEKQNRPTSNVQTHYNDTSGNYTIDYITTIILDIDLANNSSTTSIITNTTPRPGSSQTEVTDGTYFTPEEENGPGCKCRCGLGSRTHRIVGGNETKINEFPWIVAMYRRGKFYCAGALITKQHVLTAAHCIHGFHPYDIRVTLGDHDRTTRNETKSVERKVKTMKAHPNFNLFSFNNDIGVFKLDQPVEIGTNIRPACLPQDKNVIYTGKVAVVAGWGRTDERKPTSNKLRKVTVPIMSAVTCQSSGYQDTRITENMMCAGYPEGQKDSCQGDSGGPMHIRTKKGFLELAGIVSWGRGCARPNYPGVYTKVVNYLDWIQEQIGDQCMCVRP